MEGLILGILRYENNALKLHLQRHEEHEGGRVLVKVILCL